MTRFFIMIVFILFSICSLQAEEIRILTYNICNGLGMDQVKDLDRTSRVINAINPDFALIQELDQKTKRSGGQDVLQELGRRTNMIGSFGKAIDFQGGAYGIGILSKKRPISIRVVSLPGREERRALLIAEFDRFYLCCSHWSLREEDRLASARLVTKELRKLKKPVFFGGDLNAKPETDPAQEMFRNWICLSPDAPTWPADSPKVRIDYIFAFDPAGLLFANKDWKNKMLKESKVLDEKLASDHCPVLIQFDLP